jgi:hypothetical protein
VGYGGSTSYLRALFPYMPITCVDDGRYGQLKKIAEELFVKIVLGDARAVLPQIVANCTASRIAVLIDGPKGKPAVKLAKRLLLMPTVKVVAVHDLAFDAGKAHRIDSQDDNFRRAFGFLDDKVGAALTKHPRGPGLSIFHA